MPMPLSEIVNVLFSLSQLTRTRKSPSPSNNSSFDNALKRNLSEASAALETNSRKKISLLE